MLELTKVISMSFSPCVATATIWVNLFVNYYNFQPANKPNMTSVGAGSKPYLYFYEIMLATPPCHHVKRTAAPLSLKDHTAQTG